MSAGDGPDIGPGDGGTLQPHHLRVLPGPQKEEAR